MLMHLIGKCRYIGYAEDSKPGEVWIRFEGYGSADNDWIPNNSNRLELLELTKAERDKWTKIFKDDIEQEALGVREEDIKSDSESEGAAEVNGANEDTPAEESEAEPESEPEESAEEEIVVK
ncbi:hypothetical protein SARC_15659, partial [Sphaeroforma arctica JP610]